MVLLHLRHSQILEPSTPRRRSRSEHARRVSRPDRPDPAPDPHCFGARVPDRSGAAWKETKWLKTLGARARAHPRALLWVGRAVSGSVIVRLRSTVQVGRKATKASGRRFQIFGCSTFTLIDPTELFLVEFLTPQLNLR